MPNRSWTRRPANRSLGGVTPTTLHPPDTSSPNANDVTRFVYTWFTLFEHRARAERLTVYLHQDWHVAVRPGAPADDPFEIETLVAGPR
jgi:hypothetical protein